MSVPILFAIYCLAGIVNLSSAFLFRDGLRQVSKCCLMPVLLVLYLVGTDRVLAWVILALLFCWAGDILLIWKEQPRFFRLGLAAFLVGHIFYVIAFLTLATKVAIIPLVISVAVAIPLCLVILRLVRPAPEMRVPVTAYAVVIMAMSVSALQLMLAQPGVAGVLVFASSLVFMFSDTLMAYLLFHRPPKYFNVITMVPYIIAQGGIVLGLVGGLGR